MARFAFYVGRNNQESVKCIAHIPGKEEILAFEGGAIRVETPAGDQTVSVSAGLDLLLKQLTVELQHGVRDFLFPAVGNGTPKSNKRSTGYSD